MGWRRFIPNEDFVPETSAVTFSEVVASLEETAEMGRHRTRGHSWEFASRF